MLSMQVVRINALFKHASRYGSAEHSYDFRGIIESAYEELFKIIQFKEHCLHNILPPIKHAYCELRSRGHNFVLPLRK
jgi:hypothetical protein